MTDPELQLCRREEYGRGLFWASHTREEMSRPGDNRSEGGRYPNKCCAGRDLGSQEIPHPGRHPDKPQKPIGCLKWSSDV